MATEDNRDGADDNNLQSFLNSRQADPDALQSIEQRPAMTGLQLMEDMRRRRRKYFWSTCGVFVFVAAWFIYRLVMSLLLRSS